MAMDQYAQLYAKLRASILSRHFAINNRFRMNFFWDLNGLQTPPENEIDRWRINFHSGDNPLMGGGMLATCLAIEYYLGRDQSLPIIEAWVNTVGSLYKFQGDHFDGYILRWDPVLRDNNWIDNDTRSFCNEFYLNQDLTYNYCTPIHDPRSRRPIIRAEWDAAATDERQRRGDLFMNWESSYRGWEPSMDEIVGLIMGYDMIYRLLDRPGEQSLRAQAVRAEVARQANMLGDYLAENGYYLVRPGGGFAARGAAGALIALEYPFSRVFQRITGEPYFVRNGFQAVMEKADVWKALEERFNLWSVGFTLAQLWALGWPGFLAGIVAEMGLGFLCGTTGPFTPAQVGQILAIYSLSHVFNVWVNYRYTEKGEYIYTNNYAEEFAVAYGLSLLSLRRRFDDYMNGSQIASPTAWSTGFPPFLGLMGLDDDEPNVRQAYMNWLTGRRQRTDLPEDNIALSSFASAVAVLLKAGSSEELALTQKLQAEFSGLGNDLPITKENGSYCEMVSDSNPRAIYTMTGLALAWLHRKRHGQSITTPDFPALPDWNEPDPGHVLWPVPGVPEPVLNAAEIHLPLDAIQRSRPFQMTNVGINNPESVADLFYDDPVIPRSPIPPVVIPAPTGQLIYEQEFTIPESAGDVPTGIKLRMGDEYEIEANGCIWAGVIGPGENGPNGWQDRIEYDRKFPLTGRPDGHPFCLLGKLGTDGAYFFIGERRPRERYLGLETRELFLRINDDSPGNGTGTFTSRVRVWGMRLQVVDFKAVPFATIFVPSIWFRVLSEINRRARITLTVSKDGGPFYVARSEDPYGGTVPPELIGDWIDREVPTNTADPLFLWWLGKTMDGPIYHNHDGTFEFRILATDEGGGESQILATRVSIEWPELPQIPFIRTSVSHHDFGRVNLGTPAVYTFQIANEGSVPLSLIRVIDPADPAFKIVLALPDMINPSDNKPLGVQFTPAEEREYSSEIQIHSNADNQSLLTLSIHGIGVDVSVQCEELASQLTTLEEDLPGAQGTDRRDILQRIAEVRAQMRQLGCR